MKRLILVSLLFLTACHHRAGGGDTTPQPTNLNGTWDGVITVDGAPTRFYFLFDLQTGPSVAGFWNLNDVAQGRFTGTVDDKGVFDFTLDEGTACTPKGTGTADVVSKSMNLHFSGHSNCRLDVTDANGTIAHD